MTYQVFKERSASPHGKEKNRPRRTARAAPTKRVRSSRPCRLPPGWFAFLFALWTIPPVHRACGQVSVWTYHNDNARTGQNTNETILTPSNVNTNTFGALFSCPVDGYIYAQPLYIPGVAIPGQGVRNLLYIATEHDSVYAFDADSGGPPLWQTSFLNPAAGVTTVPWTLVNDLSIFPEEGITSTPVIDPGSGRLYALAATVESAGICFRLHALDITTGLEITNVLVQASYPASGPGDDGFGNIDFQAFWQNQRCGLALVNGSVYAGFASHGDQGPYHGWVLGYDAQTLAQTGVFNDAPQGGQGGIWMSGGAPAADARGNLYFSTGNADVVLDPADPGQNDYGDSFLKLSTTNGLNVADYFTPFNQDVLNYSDLDLGSGGLTALPDEVGSASHPHLLVGGGKEGSIYLVDRDNMGQYNPDSDGQIVQSLPGAISGVYGTPAYFNGRVYFRGASSPLLAFLFSGGRLVPEPDSQSAHAFGYPGAIPAVSANGATNGIVWEIQTDGYQDGAPAILHAYDANDLSLELYNSSLAGAQDQGPVAVKFSVPTVANGKVYVQGAYSVAAYGPAAWTAPPAVTPAGGFFTNSIEVTLAGAAEGAQIYYTLDNSAPSPASPLYSGPILLTNLAGVTLQAAVFSAGSISSPVVSNYFYNAASFRPAAVAAAFTGPVVYGGPARGLNPWDVAGVVPQSNWNNLAGFGGGAVPLVDGSGQPSPVTITWNCAELWGGPPGAGDGNDELFSGFIAGGSGPSAGALVSLGNVPALTYKLLVYTLCNQSGAAGHYTVNSDDSTTLYVTPDGPALPAAFQNSASAVPFNPQISNYLEFDNVQAINGVITLQAAADFNIAPINGIQLLPMGVPPAVALISPADGSVFAANSAGIPLGATAGDLDGFVTNVTFYAGDDLLFSSGTAPFSFIWFNAPPGRYILTAQATDDSGFVGTSAPVQVTILAGYLMSVPVFSGDTLILGFSADAGAGASYTLLQAPSITGPWTTNTDAILTADELTGACQFAIPVPGGVQFYQVRSP